MALDSSPRTRKWYAHIALIIAIEFAAESTRGLVLPTLFLYSEHLGGDLAFVGLLTALFSAGRLAASLLFGWLSDRVSFKALYYASAATAIVGNALYILPYSPRIHSKTLLGMSRFLVGFGAGNRSVCRANLAALTRIDQRVSYFTVLATVVFLAYALTPGLGGIFGTIDLPVGGSADVRFNGLTAPGFILVGLNLATVVLTTALFDSSVTRADAPPPKELLARACRRIHVDQPSDQWIAGSLLVFTFLNINARGMLSIFETINVPLYLQTTNTTARRSPVRVYDAFATQLVGVGSTRETVGPFNASDVVARASRFYLAIGLLGLLAFGAVHVSGRRQTGFSDVHMLLFGFAMLLVGNGVLVVLSEMLVRSSHNATTTWRLFVIGEILVWSVGSPIVSAVIVPAFSKALGTRPQGTFMGVFGASASIARMAMPLLPSLLPSWAWLFSLNVAWCVASIVALVYYLTAQRQEERRAMIHKATRDDDSLIPA